MNARAIAAKVMFGALWLWFWVMIFADLTGGW
jgi:hypothetical protein